MRDIEYVRYTFSFFFEKGTVINIEHSSHTLDMSWQNALETLSLNLRSSSISFSGKKGPVSNMQASLPLIITLWHQKKRKRNSPFLVR